MSMDTGGANHKRTAFWLFCGFFCFYFLGLGGHIYTPDGTVMFHVTRNLVMHGRSDIPELGSWPDFGGARQTDAETGRRLFYSKYGVGLSLCAIPAFIAGKALAPLVGEREKELFSNADMRTHYELAGEFGTATPTGRLWYEAEKENFDVAFEAFSVTWTMPLLVAGIVAALFLTCTGLGYPTRASLGLAVMAGVASPLWHYSKEFFSEPLSGFGLAWFFFLAVAEAKRPEPGLGWLLCGGALGTLLVAKVANAVILLPCLLLSIMYMYRYSIRGMGRGMLLVIAGAAVGAGIVCAYNVLRFGSVWSTGYGDEVNWWTTPFWEGVAGLLFSPGRGALIYCPLLFLALAGFPAFARRFPRESVFIGGVFAAHLLLYATWHVWEGGWCWGPRFLVPALPISLIPVVTLFERPPAGRFSRLAILLVLALSLVVAFNGVIVSYNDYYKWIDILCRAGGAGSTRFDVEKSFALMRWSWEHSPLLRYWGFPVKDYFVLPRAIAHPGLVLALLGAALLGLIGSCWRLGRELASSDLPGVQRTS
ncbi:MAG TPA: hypothetical protein PLP29_12200 [Candidatus Ozemobacteraceae bacterium]|nr:hypothetical protein [Candidatus Ozemobacteraceae bacterium]